MYKILFPGLRDLSVVPPVINVINYLQKNNSVTIFSYFADSTQYSKEIELITISKKPYPRKLYQRVVKKLLCFFYFYRYFLKNARKFDYIWLGVWDYPLPLFLIRMAQFKGKFIFQMHELEFNKFKYCQKVDYVIVPDENRGWITFFLSKMKSRPLVIPNIPLLPESINSSSIPEIGHIREANLNKKIILYQGTIDYKKRCIKELLVAISLLPDDILLVVMPGSFIETSGIKKIKEDSLTLGISSRVFILNSVKAPHHLFSIKLADLGIGLYRPFSLNQIYAAPNRLYEFTMFEIPLILPNFPAFKSIEAAYPFAINTVDPENPFQIAETILKALDSQNYSIGKLNAKKFKEIEGNFAFHFNNAWDIITNNS